MNFTHGYFIGIGGIGMSAIARYFLHEGKTVAGYDRTPSPLTRELEAEGALIHYDDSVEAIPAPFRDKARTLVVYTPAIPHDHSELGYFAAGGFELVKRSRILGMIARDKYVMAVAGTHGKTTTTTLVAWLNWMAGCNDIDRSCQCSTTATFSSASAQEKIPQPMTSAGTPADAAFTRSDDTVTATKTPDVAVSTGNATNGTSTVAPTFEPEVLRSAGLAPCRMGSAFLGGISKNFGSNLVLGDGARLAVEADEFDRSFLQLYPDAAVITAADADHLDIYGTHEAVREAFTAFAGQIKPGGTLIVKQGVDLPVANPGIQVYTYAYDRQADFYATNVTLLEGGYYEYDIVCPDRTIRGCRLGIPGWVNVENSVAAVALLWVAGFDEERLKEGLRTFRGVQRRFDFWVNTPTHVYMDDYAHHPRELHAAITSVKRMFPGRRLTAVFQPHLYTRTRDFYTEFAEALSEADEVILLPIYPAREEPIEGIRSEIILERITSPHEITEKENLLQTLQNKNLDILVTFGAGDIDRLCADIAQVVARKAGLR